MIEFLNWTTEHPWATFWLVVALVCVVGALGAAIGEARKP